MFEIFDELDFDEIIEINYIGVEETIDINVSGNRLFMANDILTHNSSINEQEHDHSMIAGGISKIQTADNVMSIYASDAMKERGQYQIQFLKTRNSGGVGSKIYLGFDPNTLRIFDIDPAESQAIREGTSTTADMFNELRRKNNRTADKTEEPIAETKVRDLSQIKNLIRR